VTQNIDRYSQQREAANTFQPITASQTMNSRKSTKRKSLYDEKAIQTMLRQAKEAEIPFLNG